MKNNIKDRVKYKVWNDNKEEVMFVDRGVNYSFRTKNDENNNYEIYIMKTDNKTFVYNLDYIKSVYIEDMQL